MKFERENNTNYMVLECVGGVASDYDVNILEKKLVQYLLPMHIRNINQQMLCYYDVTARQQMAGLFTYAELKWNDVCMVCESIAGLVREINKYMLDLNQVRIDPEYMYVDFYEKRVYFTYCCQETGEFEKGIRNLFDYILERFNHNSSKEEVMKVYEIYQRVVQNNYDAEKMDELVNVDGQEMGVAKLTADTKVDITDNIRNEGGQDSNYEGQKQVLDVVQPELVIGETEEKDRGVGKLLRSVKVISGLLIIVGAIMMLLPSVVPISFSMKFPLILIIAGTAVLVIVGKIPAYMFVKVKQDVYEQPYEIDCATDIVEEPFAEEVDMQEEQTAEIQPQTVLLSEYIKRNSKMAEGGVRLVNCECEETIEIDSFPAVVGSMKEQCNVFIEDMLVSRIHCCIDKMNGRFFIEDLNSTNGTKVGKEQVLPHSRRELLSGDEIMLATRVYKVEIN